MVRVVSFDKIPNKFDFESLVPALRAFFLRRLPNDAEDLLQETLLVLHQHQKMSEIQNPRAFAFGVAYRKFLRAVRSRSRRPLATNYDFDKFAGTTDLEASLATQEQTQHLIRALTRLPLRDQKVILLYYFDGLTGPELALHLGISVSSGRSVLKRARDRLRTEISNLIAAPLEDKPLDLTLSAWRDSVIDKL